MSGTDSYYTPSLLADKLTNYVEAEKVNSAVDFCVGDGALLKAVAKRYYSAVLYGIDISNLAIEKLSRDHPEWKLAQCDFCNDKLLSNIDFLNGRKFDLIMMNPPFTCKGSVIEHVVFEGQDFRLSTAMYFLFRALNYLGDNGGLYAIMPISCVYSEKDHKAWEYLKRHYNACILSESERVVFSKNQAQSPDSSATCSPNIALIYVGHYVVKRHDTTKIADFSSLPVKDVVRGCLRMQNPTYSRKPEAVMLIHTTNIKKGKLINLKSVVPGATRQIDYCGVVIPRVCNPSPNKIAILDGTKKYVLSDCVIVLRTATIHEAEKVRNSILDNWSDFVTIYKGTGAQYTTLSRVRQLFHLI